MRLRASEITPGVHRLASRYENWYLLAAGAALALCGCGHGAEDGPAAAAGSPCALASQM
jgi:hypothetical protein